MKTDYSVVTLSEISSIDQLLKNIDFLSIDNYKISSWNVIYFHSAPFMDSLIYPCIFYLMNFFKETELNIFCNPIRRNTKYLKVSEISDSFENFNSILMEHNFIYTGGYGYSGNKKIGFVSCADIEVFSIGYESDSISHLPDLCINNPLAIPKDFALKLLNEHLEFLKG